jgi:hypothetical protein
MDSGKANFARSILWILVRVAQAAVAGPPQATLFGLFGWRQLGPQVTKTISGFSKFYLQLIKPRLKARSSAISGSLKGLGMSVLDSVIVDDFSHVLDGADVGIKVDSLDEQRVVHISQLAQLAAIYTDVRKVMAKCGPGALAFYSLGWNSSPHEASP